MTKKGNGIAIYSRKSKFTGKGESIGNQIELCKDYIRAVYGTDALDDILIFEDEGFSGGNLNRPAFKKMMEVARKRQLKAIVVYRLDRISRSISDFSGLIEEMDRLDIEFVSITEKFDTRNHMGKAMMYIASVFSQLERETIAERIRDNMHELAKTGRWLGGVTPTGYASEAVKSVTIDGKSKRACKLKLIPEEAEIVKTIYDLYLENDSQTVTETELIKRGFKTKNGKYFTRFSIKAILQNPVYMIADQDAYDYFIKMEADLFSNRDAFDGIHGIMAYNRSKQEKGKTTEMLPPKEWIVSVGLHPGIIPGKVWVTIQESLERNQSKAYHKSRSNEALITGLLYCSCGSRMYPKLSRRKTTDGKPVYTYVCKMKERSQRTICNSKNANGNMMDMAIVEQIKMLSGNQGAFIRRLEESRKFYTGDRSNYVGRLTVLQEEKEEAEKKMDGLIDSLVDLDGVARSRVVKRISQLDQQMGEIDLRIRELEGLTTLHTISDGEFDRLCRLLAVFKDSMDIMHLEQKRAAVRAIVRKVVWDGVNAHVVLLGDQEDEHDGLKRLGDVGYEGVSGLVEQDTFELCKTHWGEDSK